MMTDEQYEKIFKEIEQVFQKNKISEDEAFNVLMCIGVHLLIKSNLPTLKAQKMLDDVKDEYIQAKKDYIF